MTEQEYNKAEGVRRSDLWRMRESPEKFKWFLDNPEPETPALIFGSMVHKLLLEPDSFDDEYIVAPEVDRRTKAGKEEWAAFCAEADGKTVISREDYVTACAMVGKVRSVPLAEELIRGEHEVPFFWTDEDTGEKCKVKCDCLTTYNGRLTVVDYKTAACAQTDKFNSKMYELGYTLQAAMYTEGVMHGKGLTERPDFIFLVQEKKPPYAVNLVSVPEEVMLDGLDTFREFMGTLHVCKETGFWYGYTGAFGEINEAYLPGWKTIGKEEDE